MWFTLWLWLINIVAYMKYFLCHSDTLLPFLALELTVVQSIQTRRSYEMIKATCSKFILPQCYCPGSTLKGRTDGSGAAHGPQLHPSDSKPEKTFICGFKSVEGYAMSKYSILIFEHSPLSLPYLKGGKNTATSCVDDDTSMCHKWNAKQVEAFLLTHSHCAKYEISCQWGCL